MSASLRNKLFLSANLPNYTKYKCQNMTADIWLPSTQNTSKNNTLYIYINRTFAMHSQLNTQPLCNAGLYRTCILVATAQQGHACWLYNCRVPWILEELFFFNFLTLICFRFTKFLHFYYTFAMLLSFIFISYFFLHRRQAFSPSFPLCVLVSFAGLFPVNFSCTSHAHFESLESLFVVNYRFALPWVASVYLKLWFVHRHFLLSLLVYFFRLPVEVENLRW